MQMTFSFSFSAYWVALVMIFLGFVTLVALLVERLVSKYCSDVPFQTIGQNS